MDRAPRRDRGNTTRREQRQRDSSDAEPRRGRIDRTREAVPMDVVPERRRQCRQLETAPRPEPQHREQSDVEQYQPRRQWSELAQVLAEHRGGEEPAEEPEMCEERRVAHDREPRRERGDARGDRECQRSFEQAVAHRGEEVGQEQRAEPAAHQRMSERDQAAPPNALARDQRRRTERRAERDAHRRPDPVAVERELQEEREPAQHHDDPGHQHHSTADERLDRRACGGIRHRLGLRSGGDALSCRRMRWSR
jgi:hypothetical protein